MSGSVKSKRALDLNIAIVGGGIAGLATAVALNRKGFKNLVVYERDTDANARTQGYSFNLFAPVGGLGYLEELGLKEELELISYEGRGLRIVDCMSGSVLLKLEHGVSRGPQRSRRVMRAGLRKLLVEVCQREGVKIVWNSRIIGFEENDTDNPCVTLNFESGDQAQFDLLIGADGTNSMIRKALIGDELLYTGYTFISGLLSKQQLPEALTHPWYYKKTILGAGRGIVVFATYHVNDELYWGVCREMPQDDYRSFGGDPEKLKAELLERLNEAASVDNEPLPHLRNIIRKGDVAAVIDLHDREPLKLSSVSRRLTPKRNSRVTLMGDAAHPMVPFRAQGGNSALLDSNELVEHLCRLISAKDENVDLVGALSNYEASMLARTTPEVFASRRMMHALHTRRPLAIFARNSTFSLLDWWMNSWWKPVLVKTLGIGFVALLVGSIYSRVNGTSLISVITTRLRA